MSISLRSPRNRINDTQKFYFKTRNFTVRATIEIDHGYQYDGDDEDGETQSALNSGEMVAFDTDVTVEFRGEVIGRASLGGSVYDREDVHQFFDAHRDPDPMNRNCSIRYSSERSVICHYFPDLVSEAITEARAHFRDMPRLRDTAA